ncbi:MAG: DUF423 domain-containing protein [Elusimicrobia bacterium]|nr:DUF423 domain-containing protein [Elusimicrobiota bacterium]
MSHALWIRLGAGFMFLAVGLGAFGAHALKARLPPELLAVFETGVRYQVYHALALLLLAALRGPEKAGWCFAAGIVLFSGSLYLLALTGVRKWGAVAPVGGLLFLIGWLIVLFGRDASAGSVLDRLNL